MMLQSEPILFSVQSDSIVRKENTCTLYRAFDRCLTLARCYFCYLLRSFFIFLSNFCVQSCFHVGVTLNTSKNVTCVVFIECYVSVSSTLSEG